MVDTAIGIVGGTFDPIHLGHLVPAHYAAQALKLDKVLLLPNAIPPHRDPHQAPAQARLKMVQLAAQLYPEFSVDTREWQRDKPSYTYDTLVELRAENPDAALCFICGVDAFSKLDSWYRWQSLLSLSNFVVCQRPDQSLPEQGPVAELLKEHCATTTELSAAGSILLVDTPLLDISSTAIRERLTNGQSCAEWLPAQVWSYMQEHNLYR